MAASQLHIQDVSSWSEPKATEMVPFLFCSLHVALPPARLYM